MNGNFNFDSYWFNVNGLLQAGVTAYGNNVIRDAIMNYTSVQGQQAALEAAQQAAIQEAMKEAAEIAAKKAAEIQAAQQTVPGGDTQQGGSGNGGDTHAGSGGDSTSTGVSAFNGNQNFQDRLNYFYQAMAEQAENNLEGFLATFDDEPMKSILEQGKNSPYLSELDEEDAKKITELVRGSYKIARDTLYMKNSTTLTQEDFIQFTLGIGQFLNDNISFLGTLNDLLGKYNTPATNLIWKMTPLEAIFAATAGLGMSTWAYVSATNDFNKRYPNAREDAWREVVGGSPSLFDKLNLSNRREVNGILRSIDPDRYDKTNLAAISTTSNVAKWAVASLAGEMLILAALSAPVTIPIATMTGVVAGLGLLATGCISALEASAKTGYLQKVHGYEQSDWQTFTEQLFGQDYGAFKNWFKGNENPSSSQNTNRRAERVFSGSASNDTLFNIEDNYLIDAGTGNDEISNVGDYVTINAGAGNDYAANLGDNVEINGGADKNVVDNAGSFVTMNFEDGNNYVDNVGDYVTVNAGDGDNYFDNVGNFVEVQAGNGANDIENFGSNVIFKTGNGSDFIVNYGDNTTINAGNGNNIIANYSNHVSINTGENKDTIANYDANVLINAGKGNDFIENTKYTHWSDTEHKWIAAGTTPDDAIIAGGAGSDTIRNYGATRVSINGGDDNDYIYNSTKPCNMPNSETSEQEATPTLSDNSTIKTCDEPNSATSVQEETPTLFDNNVESSGGAEVPDGSGNTSSDTSPDKATLDGGKGNDFIGNEGAKSVITGGDGKDTICNIGEKTTLSGGKGNDSINNWGANSSITGGNGDDTLSNWKADNVTLSGGKGNDLILNSGAKNILIDGGANNDYIYNGVIYGWSSETGNFTLSPDNVTLNGGDGDDLILNSGAKKVSIFGGDGNDVILNEKCIEWTGKIITSPDNVTIDAGTGNDTIINEGDNAKIIYSSGNKLIKGFNKTSTLQIGNGTTDTYFKATVGSDILISFGSGVMTLDGAATLSNVNILGTEKPSWLLNNTVANYGNLFSLSNVKNTDSIIVNTKKKIVTLKADNLTGKNVSLTGDYSLKLAKDVPTSTTKTAGAFTKFKKGTATYKTSSFSPYYSLKDNKITYTPASGGKTVSIKNLNSSATLDKIKSGITVAEQKNGSLKITFKNADVLTTKNPAITPGGLTYTVAVAKSLKPAALTPDWNVSGTNASLKSDTGAGYSVKDNNVVYNKKVTGLPQVVLSGLIKNSSLSAPVKKVVTLDTKVLGKNTSLKSNDGSYTVKLMGNMSKKTFTASDKADTLNVAANNAAVLGGAGNDIFTVTGAKVTLTGGKGNDSFNLSGKNPVLIYGAGDGNDTLNFVAGMQISLTGNTSIKTLGKSNSDLVLGFGKNSSLKITGAKSTDTIKVSNASGSVTLLAEKFDLVKSLTFNSKNSSVNVDKNFTGSLSPSDDIYLGGSKLSNVSTINASEVTGNVTVSGNAKANTILGGKKNDSILGGDGNDSLNGGKGNDTLWGGKGNDVFIFDTGHDVIADFTAGQDKIKIAKGTISKTSLSGSDVIFTVGKGSLTVKNAKGKSISLLDSAGKASSTVVGAQSLTNSNKASVTLGADMGFVDASARTKAVAITGNALANTIIGGTKNDKLYGQAGNDMIYGGKGNDSLWGGAGNDSLWGDDGADTFFYSKGDGKDVVFGFDNNDLLQITGAFSPSCNKSKKEIYFKVDSTKNAITLKDFSATSFNVNGDSYKISGSKLVKQ